MTLPTLIDIKTLRIQMMFVNIRIFDHGIQTFIMWMQVFKCSNLRNHPFIHTACCVSKYDLRKKLKAAGKIYSKFAPTFRK